MTGSRPNVLWLMTDEQRTDSVGAYGSAWARTPHLDRLAAEGVPFRNALTPSPVCVSARTSLLTGLCPSDTGVWSNAHVHRRPDIEALTLRFESAGYRTASFGKQHYSLAGRPFQDMAQIVLSDAVGYFGYAADHDPGDFDVVQYPSEPYAWVFGGAFPADAATKAEARAVQAAMTWLDALEAGQPFLLRVSFNAPHTPVAPPPPFDECVHADEIDLDDRPRGAHEHPAWIRDWLWPASRADRLTPEQIRRARQCYYGEVAFVDHLVGNLLAWMDDRGLLDNTVVAFVSDHGTHLGDFGLVQKQTFYEPVVNVPFFFHAPGRVPARPMIDTPVETRSLLPTLLDLAELPVPRELADLSLAPSLRDGTDPTSRPVFSELALGSFEGNPDHRIVLVRSDRWKLSVRLDPQSTDHTLYDLADDPLERRNLADDEQHRAVRRDLETLIEEHLR